MHSVDEPEPTVLRERCRYTGTHSAGSIYRKCPEQADVQIKCGFVAVRR